MASGEGGVVIPSEGEEASSSLQKKRTKTDAFLMACKCLSAITASIALLCAAANTISAARSFTNGQDHILDGVFDGILRCYAVVIALFVAVAETEWERILKFWQILEYWPGRGMLQVFVAIMTKSLSNGISMKNVEGGAHKVASYLLLACGLIHIVAGFLCIGRLKKARLQKAIMNDQVIKEYEDLERRRKELEGLLPYCHRDSSH